MDGKTAVAIGAILGILFLMNLGEETFKSQASSVPEEYYVYSKMNWGNLGYPGLEKLVQGGFVSPYEENKFDCSEMSAYMEWYLEKYGFNASICVAQDFRGFGEPGAHAWVKVDTIDGKTAYIEATAQRDLIVKEDKDYNNPERVYSSIYEVRNMEEFDWWNTITR